MEKRWDFILVWMNCIHDSILLLIGWELYRANEGEGVGVVRKCPNNALEEGERSCLVGVRVLHAKKT